MIHVAMFCARRELRKRPHAGDMEIDVKNFNNVMLMAILMALIGVALSLGSVEDVAARAASKGKTARNGSTLSKAKKTK